MTDSNKIRLRPTIPIRGGSIEVSFGARETFYDSAALFGASCKIPIPPGDEHEWQEISVQAVCDNTNQAFAPSAFTFTVTSTSDTQAPFWGFYQLPPVMVSYFYLPNYCAIQKHANSA